MKSLFKIIIFSSFAFMFASCEDVVQIKLDEGSNLYVIDAFVNSLRTDQTIKITTNASYFSNSSPSGVSGANVILTDLTENKQYVFSYTSNGNYVYTLAATDTIAKPNHNYSLNVTIDGGLYTAATMQKRYASIDSISVQLNDNSFGFGSPSSSTDTTFFCVLFAKDKADAQPDFYWIKTYRNDTLFSEASDLNLNIDGTGGEITNSPVDSLDFTPPSTLLGFKRYRKYDKCKVEVHSIMKDTYNFFTQAQTQINNGGLFATTPENVKTNIATPQGKIKAVGWFSVSSVATKSITVK